MPTDSIYWLYLGLFGKTGNIGLNNLIFVGAWNNDTAYTVNQVVFVDYTFYWAIQSNQGQNPTTDIDNVYWGVLFTVKPQKIIANVNQPSNQNTNDIWLQII